MKIARFEFTKEGAEHLAWNNGQTIVEMAFPEIMELIEYCKEFEDVIENVTVLTEGQVISITEFIG